MKIKILSFIFTIFTIASLSNCVSTRQIKIIDINLTNEHYSFVIKKGNEDLKNDFNSFMQKIQNNGTFDEIVAKYFEGIGQKNGVKYISDSNYTNDETTFVVATNCPFEPFEYIGIDGLIYGIDIEIAALYAKSKNLDLVVKNMDFDAIFTNVDACYADIGMAGITITDERKKLYDFTNIYYQSSQKLVVSLDNTDFDNCKNATDIENIIRSLDKSKIGYQIGTTGNWYVKGDPSWGYEGFDNVKAVGYKSAQLALQDIVNKQIYGAIIDGAPAKIMVEAINKIN